MDQRHKWDLGNEFSSIEKKSDEKKNAHAFNLLLNAQNFKQFYEFHLHEKTFTNGNLHRNEIKKLIHLTIFQDKFELNQIHVESFDRIHLDRNLALSEKEFLDQIDSILGDVKLEVNKYGKEFKIKNFNEIHSQYKRVIEKLKKNYTGENAERHYRFLKMIYATPKSILRNLFNYKLYGLLLPKFYGYFDAEKERKQRVTYTQLIPNMIIHISEKAEILIVDEQKKSALLQINGKIEDHIDTEACHSILNRKNIIFQENDQAKLDGYQGLIEFQKETGLVKNASLNIALSFGENYKKDIHYSLNSISYEEA